MDSPADEARQRGREGLTRLVGRAPIFLRAIAQVPVVANLDASVLIVGETGTGKELVARSIHYLSPRAAYPFVAVNCGALPETLIETELYGHERGAFTDAHVRRPGLIAQAGGGTLFLDEIDTLSIRAQVALLRVLQDGTFRAVGSAVEQRTNVRFVAATNATLEHLARVGQFRSDLYYRLSVFSIALPALRNRRDDIVALAQHFIEKHAPPGRSGLALSADAIATLLDYAWPGNIRELENAIFRAVNIATGDLVEAEDLGLSAPTVSTGRATTEEPAAYKTLKRRLLEAFERDYLQRLLMDHGGNVTHAARAAGKERRELGRMLKRHGLNPKKFAAG